MLTEQMSPHPDYKLLTVRNIPITSASTMEFSSYQWPGLMKHLRQMLVADALLDEGKVLITTIMKSICLLTKLVKYLPHMMAMLELVYKLVRW
jgi:hypothetical protein